MAFIAHTENADGIPHLLSEHLRGVGNLAREFAAIANPEMAEAAEWAGLLHDLGKYRDEFQMWCFRRRAVRTSSSDGAEQGITHID